MAFTVSTSCGYQRDASALTGSTTISAELEVAIDVAIPLATDTLVAFTLDYSQCKCLMMLASQDMTVETNANNAAGGQTISLKANVPLFWQENSGITCPITTDITALYVTAATAGTLKIRALVDPVV
jgi:hypothetical protein